MVRWQKLMAKQRRLIDFYDDQVDAASGAFSKLSLRREWSIY